MADSDFWRDLADKFRALSDPEGLLCAHWISKKGLPYEWSLRSTRVVWGGRSVQVQFEALARRGGLEIDKPNDRSPLDWWLDSLSKDVPGDKFGSGGEIVDGKPADRWGSIDRICETSADFCKILESRALDAEIAGVPTSTKPVQFKSALSELRALGLTIDIDENTAARILGGLQIIDGHYFQGHYHQDKSRPAPTTRQHFFDAYHTIAEKIVNASTPDEVLENMIPAMIEAFRLKEDWRPRMSYDTLKRFLGGPVSEWKGKRLLMQTETAPPPRLTVGLEELKSIRTSLDDQDALILKNPERDVPLSQVRAIKGLFDRITTDAPGLIPRFTFERDPTAVRAQLRAARSNVQHKISALERHGTKTANAGESGSIPTCAQLKRLIDETHISTEELAEAIEADPRSVYRHLSGETLPQPKFFAKYERVFSERLERTIHITKLPGKCQ
jgi:hypothetical protein